jgi:phosphonate transport system substrate-binding protein
MDTLPGNDSAPSPRKRFLLTVGRARVFKAAVFLILTAGVLFSLYNVIKAPYLDEGASRFSPSKWVNLSENGATAAVPVPRGEDRPLFRVAVAPVFSPEKSLEMYQGFINYLAGKLKRAPVAVYRPAYSETNDLVRYGRCDIAIVCTYLFVRGEREFGMQALAVPQIAGETTSRSLILVPMSSQAQSLIDFRGRRFGSADILSTAGWLFPATTLMKSGEDPDKFFGEHLTTGSDDKSVLALRDGFIDLTAVHGIVYDLMSAEDPSIPEKTRILLSSPPSANCPIAINPEMDKKLRQDTLSVLLNMQDDAQGKLILDKLQIERFVIPPKGLFDGLRQSVARFEGWK